MDDIIYAHKILTVASKGSSKSYFQVRCDIMGYFARAYYGCWDNTRKYALSGLRGTN